MNAHEETIGSRRRGSATRDTILATATRLFAEQGVDHVALHRIAAAAGQRNRTAIQYHFGGREGLLVAILDHHEPRIAERRGVILDEIEETGASHDTRRLAEAFVLPLAQEARATARGLDYVRTAAQLIGHPRWSLFRLETRRSVPSPRRLDRVVNRGRERAPAEATLPVMITATGLAYHGIADWSRAAETELGGITPSGWDALVAHLVHAVAGVFSYRPAS